MPDINNDDFADSYTDTAAPIGTIAPGGSATGTIESGGDVDLFAVQLQAGTAYFAEVQGSFEGGGTLVIPRLKAYDANGTILPELRFQSRSNSLNILATSSGLYYLSASDYYNVGTGTYTLNVITKTGYGSSVSISDTQVIEGNSGQSSAIFTVSRTGGTGAFSVDFATSDLSYTGPDNSRPDFVPTSGTLNFAAGEMTKTIAIPILGDSKMEFDEQFAVMLSNATLGAITADDYGLGLIINDDDTDEFADSFIDVTHPFGQMNVGGSITGNIDLPDDRDLFAIQLQAGKSYRLNLQGAPSNLGTLPTAQLYLYNDHGTLITQGDTLTAEDEIIYTVSQTGTYYLGAASGNLYSPYEPSSYTLSAALMPEAYGSQVAFEVNHDSIEGNSGNSFVSVIVNRTGSLAGNFTVDYSFSDYRENSATPNVDYVSRSGRLNFAEGQTQQTISIEIIGDTIFEQDERFQVNLSNATNGANITYQQMSLAILNDDVAPDDYADTLTDTSTPKGLLSVNSTALGTIETTTDIDIFSTTLQGGVTYTFQLKNSPFPINRIEPIIALYDSTGRIITQSNRFDIYGYGRFSYTPDHSANFHVSAGSTGAKFGTYELSLAADDFADSIYDTAVPAGPIQVGETRAGWIESAGDFDVFAINLQAGATYRFSINEKSSDMFATSFVPTIRVYDLSGTPVPNLLGTGAISLYPIIAAGAAGTYFVTVGDFFNTGLGTYSIFSEQLFSEDSDIYSSQSQVSVLHGLGGNDQISGSDSFESIFGDDGNDILDGREGADQLYGGSGNDIITFDDADTVVDGGDGFDTAIYSDNFYHLLRGFDLVGQNIESLKWQQNSNTYEISIVGNQLQERVTDTAQTELSFYQRTVLYEAGGPEDLVDTIRDDGTRTIFDFDLAQSATWRTILQTYDPHGRLDSTNTIYDDFSRVLRDEDQASTNDWRDATYVYGTNSRLDYQDTNYDDGVRLISDSDQNGEFVWDTYIARYAPGGAMDYQDFRYDSGLRIIFDMDQGNAAAWASQVNVYAPGNVLDYQDTTYDDGRRVIYDGDNGDASPVWDIWESFFDTSGVLTTQRITYDDGSMRVFYL